MVENVSEEELPSIVFEKPSAEDGEASAEKTNSETPPRENAIGRAVLFALINGKGKFGITKRQITNACKKYSGGDILLTEKEIQKELIRFRHKHFMIRKDENGRVTYKLNRRGVKYYESVCRAMKNPLDWMDPKFLED